MCSEIATKSYIPRFIESSGDFISLSAINCGDAAQWLEFHVVYPVWQKAETKAMTRSC
jgi:hypothetical protein